RSVRALGSGWPRPRPAAPEGAVRALAGLADPPRALIPAHLSRRGHPALVGRDLLSDIARIPPEEGLRGLWRIRAGAVLEVPVDDPGVVRNVDTPADYRKALEEG